MMMKSGNFVGRRYRLLLKFEEVKMAWADSPGRKNHVRSDKGTVPLWAAAKLLHRRISTCRVARTVRVFGYAEAREKTTISRI